MVIVLASPVSAMNHSVVALVTDDWTAVDGSRACVQRGRSEAGGASYKNAATAIDRGLCDAANGGSATVRAERCDLSLSLLRLAKTG